METRFAGSEREGPLPCVLGIRLDSTYITFSQIINNSWENRYYLCFGAEIGAQHSKVHWVPVPTSFYDVT